jgi:cytochrome c-type biogenesis protein CcmH
MSLARRSTRIVAVLLALSCPMLLRAVDPTTLPNDELQQRYESLTHELRCMQCMNNSIADSPVGLASDLRQQVKEQLLAGKSDAEIRAWMVDRYGKVILFTPPMDRSAGWVWAAPVLALLGGLVIGVRIVRRRARLVDSDASIVEGDDVPR